MKLIVAGSRTLEPSADFIENCLFMLGLWEQFDEIVSGKAKGVDLAGEKFAAGYGFEVKQFPADWDTHGKKAGVLRNKEMAIYADALLLIWDGVSRGSANMRKEMLALGKPVYEVVIRKVV